MIRYQFDPSTLSEAFHDRNDLDFVREMVVWIQWVSATDSVIEQR